MFTLPPITLPGIDAYAEAHSTPDPGVVTAATGDDLGMGHLVSGTLVAGLLRMIIHAQAPRTVLDVGTFTGYSALSMAVALPPEARVISCEVDPERAEAARANLRAAGYADRVEVHVGPAVDTIAAIEGEIDLAFVDADKVNYHRYVDAVVDRLSDRGLVVCDNTLWRGEIIDAGSEDTDVRALRAFNERIAADPRLAVVMLTVRDGVSLIRRVPRGS